MEEKHIGAGCGLLVFNKDGKLLLGLRNYNQEIADSEMHEEGTWSCPGGNIEYGETFEQAVTREAKEETGIDIKDPELRNLNIMIDCLMYKFQYLITICH